MATDEIPSLKFGEMRTADYLIDCPTCVLLRELQVRSVYCDQCNGTGRVPDDNFPAESDELLTAEEAQRAYEEAEPIPLSPERIREIVEYATGDELRDHDEEPEHVSPGEE